MTMANSTNEPLPKLPPRKPDAHKGDFGTALIIGGSRGMSGAVTLAGMAALRGGAGLVRLAVPDVCLETIAGFEPSYMTVPLASDPAGRIALTALPQIIEHSAAASVLALGPGLGRSDELNQLVARLYREIEKPMVVDADALNALSTQPDVLAKPGGPRVLTPHPGEFARLVGKKLDGDQRQQAAVDLAGPMRRGGTAERTSHANNRRKTAGDQHHGQSGHGHRRLGRHIDRADNRPFMPASRTICRRATRCTSARAGRRPGRKRKRRSFADRPRFGRISAGGVSGIGRSPEVSSRHRLTIHNRTEHAHPTRSPGVRSECPTAPGRGFTCSNSAFSSFRIFMLLYRILADVVVAIHLALVGFIVIGMAAILLGIVLKWRWVRNFWFRIIHLPMIATVVEKTILGVSCPLTDMGRSTAGKGRRDGSGGDIYRPDAARDLVLAGIAAKHADDSLLSVWPGRAAGFHFCPAALAVETRRPVNSRFPRQSLQSS